MIHIPLPWQPLSGLRMYVLCFLARVNAKKSPKLQKNYKQELQTMWNTVKRWDGGKTHSAGRHQERGKQL